MGAHFTSELTDLLNKHSIDKECNTPDFILAEFLVEFIYVYKFAIHKRNIWLASPEKNETL